MLEDYAILETKRQERVVFENDAFLLLCPWWATWPFETMILSKAHKRALVDLNEQEQVALAEVISQVTRRYDNLFETHFPYSKSASNRPNASKQQALILTWIVRLRYGRAPSSIGGH
jgi:UDPglucose--hexose-1-phosphate uridylyltransferase